MGTNIYKYDGGKSTIIGSCNEADIRAGAAILLGLFDGTCQHCMLPDHFTNKKPDSDDEGKKEDPDPTPSPPTGCLSTLIGIVCIGAFFAVIILFFHWLRSPAAPLLIDRFLALITKWHIFAIAVGLSVFIVSIIYDSGITTAIVEAILAGVCYQLTLLFFVPGPVNTALDRFMDGINMWFLTFGIFLLPCLIDTVFLAIGSASNSRLRKSYRILTCVYVFLVTTIIYFWFLRESLPEQSVWNLFWDLVFGAIFVIISESLSIVGMYLILKPRR